MDRALIAGNVTPVLVDDAGNFWPASNEGLDGFNVTGIQSSSLDLLRQISMNIGSAGVTVAGVQTVTPSAMSGTTDDGVAWQIAAGTTMLIDVAGANQEQVVVLQANATQFVANFTKTHSASAACYVDVFMRTRQAPGQRGAVLVSSDGYKATYRYAVQGFTPQATPTAFCVIQGSATKTVRVKRVKVSGGATAAGDMPFQLQRWSTAGTLGSAVLTALTAVKHDINDPAATAVVSTVGTANYTTQGTGNTIPMAVDRIQLPALGSGVGFNPLTYDFATRQDKALVLRGTTDIIVLSGAGGAVPSGGILDIEIETVEDLS